jgi:hypothetical protein
MAAVQQIAEIFSQCIVRAKNSDGEDYVKFSPKPAHLEAIVLELHEGRLPDDWIYRWVAEALEAIAEIDHLDDDDPGFADELDDSVSGESFDRKEQFSWLSRGYDRFDEYVQENVRNTRVFNLDRLLDSAMEEEKARIFRFVFERLIELKDDEEYNEPEEE